MDIISSCGANELHSSAQPNIKFTDDGFPVRAVCFSFEHQHLACNEIATYFDNFGKVVRFEFRVWPEPIYTSGFVQYQQPEHAAEVLNRSHCKIDGVFVRVKQADSCHQPKVPYAPTCSTTQSTDDYDTQTANGDFNGIHAPDLCLRKIFGHLNVLDLNSVAEACTRFQSIARSQFSTYHKAFDEVDLIAAAETMETNATGIQVWDSFLKNFGPSIEALNVSAYSIKNSNISITDNQVLELITKYCTELLNILWLRDFSVESRFEQKLRPLFARVKTLNLEDCKFDCDIFQMLEDCRQLTKLSILHHSTPVADFSLQFHLPELKTISFKYVNEFSKQQIIKFLECNGQLEKVSIYFCSGINLDILSEIVRCVPLVKKISFATYDDNNSEVFTRNAMQLKNLRSLKKLKLDCSANSPSSIFSEIATAKIPLEFLEVGSCQASQQLISSICKIETLNAVGLVNINALKPSHLHRLCKDLPGLNQLIVGYCPDIFDKADLIKLVQCARKLEELVFWHFFPIKIDEELFNILIGIIKNRPKSLPLKIIVPRESTPLKNVPDELVTANRDKLRIDNKCLHFCKCDMRYEFNR